MLSGARCSVPRIGRTYRRNPDSPAVQGLSRQCKPVLIPNPTAGLNRWKYGERDRSVCARETENRSFNFEKFSILRRSVSIRSEDALFFNLISRHVFRKGKCSLLHINASRDGLTQEKTGAWWPGWLFSERDRVFFQRHFT